MNLDRADRRRLRSALSSAVPWLDRPDVGPRAVDAGQCDRCGLQPRLIPTCGPVQWRSLCRACAVEVGLDAWCDGHAADGQEILAWAAGLPPWWGDAVVLWWITTGEVDTPPQGLAPGLPGPVLTALPGEVRAALPPSGPDVT